MARQLGVQGSGVVSVQGRSSVFSRAGRSFLDQPMAGAPGWEMQLPDELPLLFPCLLPPRFPAELLPPSASQGWVGGGGSPAAPWLLGLLTVTLSPTLPTSPAHCCWALHLRDKGSK